MTKLTLNFKDFFNWRTGKVIIIIVTILTVSDKI